MAKPIAVKSAEELDTLISSHEYTIIDFWATWCPPCKAIAPVFEKLASENANENDIAFAKVDVDTQTQLAKRYRISAMPTFLLVRRGDSITKAVRGADAAGIKSMITYARKKINSEEVSAEEEEAHTATHYGADSGRGIIMPLVLLAIVIWYFFLR